MYVELELQVVRVAEHDGRPISGVDDPGVFDTLLVEGRYPAPQLIFIRDPEGQMVQTNTPLVKAVRRRGLVMTHHGHADARRMSHRHALEGVLTNLIYHSEAQYVPPPIGRAAAVCHGQIDV